VEIRPSWVASRFLRLLATTRQRWRISAHEGVHGGVQMLADLVVVDAHALTEQKPLVFIAFHETDEVRCARARFAMFNVLRLCSSSRDRTNKS
jgi:hypothetical protein